MAGGGGGGQGECPGCRVYDSVERADRVLEKESALDPDVRGLAMRFMANSFQAALTRHQCENPRQNTNSFTSP